MLSIPARFLAGFAFFMGALAARAQQDAGSPFIETRFERVHLRNGNTIDGHLVRNTNRSVVLKLNVGEMEIRRDMIDRVETVRMRSLRETPTPPPPPKKPDVFVVDSAKPRTEPTEPDQKEIAPAPPNFASSISPEVRNTIDSAISTWGATPSHLRGDLSLKLEPLSPEGLKYLCLLLDEKPRRRVPTEPLCVALGRKRDPAALPTLVRMLETNPPAPLKDREAAVAAIGQIDAAECVPPLIQALEDPTGSVWRVASDSLVALASRFPAARVVDTLLLRLEKAAEKGPFAVTLGAVGGDDAYRGLLYLVRGGKDEDRLAAMQGLMRLIRPEDGDHIMPSLTSPSPAVRKAACALLGRAKYKPAVKDLIEMLAEEEGGAALDAHRALVDITGQPLARQIDLWKSWWEVAGSKQIPK